MIIFPDGIKITFVDHQCLLHLVVDPERWLLDVIAEKATLRREALIREWRPRLFADPKVTNLPANSQALLRLIMSQPDYKTRAAADAALVPPVLPSRYNVIRYEATDKSGTTVTLFPDGIPLADVDCHCILAYVHDLDDWVVGALMGQINRGRKQLISQYHPIINADASVKNIQATENGFISAVVSRSDYKNRTARDSAITAELS